jgi:putative ABC transport system permease protein
VSFRNVVRVALAAIGRNKVRSGLTALGVIIGVASVIAMVALGSGARSAIDEQVQSQGTDLIYVSAGSSTFGGVRSGAGAVTSLVEADAQAIAELPQVARLTPVVRGRAQLVAGNQNWNASIEGGDEDYVVIRRWQIASGAGFGARDVQLADKVLLLGDTVARTLFPDADPVGQVVRVGRLPFRVVGVLAAKGQGPRGEDQDDVVIAPWTTIQKKMLGITHLHQVSVAAADPEKVEEAAVAITRLLRERHRIGAGDEDDFSVRTVEEIAAMRSEMANTMTGLLMGVASVSLLVGGIGIMNIMLVSVTERTREIGLRLAIGARPRDVLRQFLAEAIALSFAGGLTGMLLGIGVSSALTEFLGWPTAITADAVALAFLFSAAVGVFFGYYPARTAARLDPIEALRHE